MQVFCLDNFRSYAKEARLGTQRMVYSLAKFMFYTFGSLIVEAAFLNSPVIKDFFVSGPPGLEPSTESLVYVFITPTVE